jgi:hypothetical protein
MKQVVYDVAAAQSYLHSLDCRFTLPGADARPAESGYIIYYRPCRVAFISARPLQFIKTMSLSSFYNTRPINTAETASLKKIKYTDILVRSYLRYRDSVELSRSFRDDVQASIHQNCENNVYLSFFQSGCL